MSQVNNFFEADILQAKATRLYKEKKYQEALEIFLKALAIYPNHLVCRNALSCLRDDMGDTEGALEDLNSLIEIAPQYEIAYYNRGYMYKKTGKYSLAVRDYTKAIRLGFVNEDTYLSRARCYEKLGEYDLLMEDCIEATRLVYPGKNPKKLVSSFYPSQLEQSIIAIKRLIKAGYYPGYWGEIKSKIIILPDRRCDRMIISPKKIHVGKTNNRLLKKMGGRYTLVFNSDFDKIMDRLEELYLEGSETLLAMLRYIYSKKSHDDPQTESVSFVTVALYLDGRLVAADLGAMVSNKIYISFTGYHDENSAGSAQIILLARCLEENGFALIDFGPSTERWDKYKLQLGFTRVTADGYSSLFDTITTRRRIGGKKKKNKRRNDVRQGLLFTDTADPIT